MDVNIGAEPSATEQVAVLIAGGGPVGLTLALELEHHGIKAIVVERNPDTPATRRWTSPTAGAWSCSAGSESPMGSVKWPCPKITPSTFVVTTVAGRVESRRVFAYPTVEQRRAQTANTIRHPAARTCDAGFTSGARTGAQGAP